MNSLWAVLGLAFVGLVWASEANFDDYVVLRRRGLHQVPSYYTLVPNHQGDDWHKTPVTFTIGLKQRNLDILENLFWRVSNPKDALYGKHLKLHEINSLVAPEASARDLVISWIQNLKVSMNTEIPFLEIVDRADALKVTTTVGFTEALFRTSLAAFRRTDSHQSAKWVKFIGSLSIPKTLQPIIHIVTGIVEFPPIPQRPRVYAATYTGSCNVPYTMKRMYSVPLDLIADDQRASQAPYSDQGTKKEGFGEADLQTFETINNVVVKPITNLIGNDVVNYISGDTDTEAALDVQCLLGFGQGANTSFWVMNEWMYEFAQEILNTNDPPLVNSMSYGWYESQQCRVDGNCSGTDEDYVLRTDTEFQKLGLMGITMLAASGDDGTEPTRKCTEMRPDYPASSAYVLSVGATAVISSSNGAPLGSDAPPVCTDKKWNCACSTSNQEEAAMQTNNAGFDSGGGFSNYIPRPSFQNNAVKQYLKSGVTLPASNLYNVSNRGYPDVAAVGAAVLIISNGASERVGGTSASTPIWGGLITLLNNDRLKAGKSPLGFINTMLYQMWEEQPSNFIDITVGTNGGGCTELAFDAAKGWDPVTGLGSPNFTKIRAYVAKLP